MGARWGYFDMILEPALAALLATGIVTPEAPKILLSKPAIIKPESIEFSKHMLAMPLTMGILSSRRLPSFQTGGFSASGTNLASYSFTSCPIGSASSTRYVIVGVTSSPASGSPAAAPTVTVGGAATTLLVTGTQGGTWAARSSLYITSSPFTSGTTATVAVTLGNTQDWVGVYTAAVYDLPSTTPNATLVDFATAYTGSISVIKNGIVIGFYGYWKTTSAATWTNLTTQGSSIIVSGSSAMSAAYVRPASTQSLTVTVSDPFNDPNNALVVASWSS